MNLKEKRVEHHFTQLNQAPPDVVFPLLCPVREADWVPGWQYQMLYSRSGVAELGCVFVTPEEDGSETIWQCTVYDPEARRVGYAWVRPGLMTAQILIQLETRNVGQSAAHIHYIYTGLSEAGNAELERMDVSWFEHKMRSWEEAINYYLRTGQLINTAGWQ